MDGVIFDTERIAIDSWRLAFAESGFDAPVGVLMESIGIDLTGTIALFTERFGPMEYGRIEERRYALAASMMEAGGPPVKEGIPALLAAIGERTDRIALATSTSTAAAVSLLERGGLLPRFAAVVGGDRVGRGKPAPDIYLRAATELGVDPVTCTAFEDSGPGILSSLSAGMRAVFIRDLRTPDAELLSRCTALYESAAEALRDIEGLLEYRG